MDSNKKDKRYSRLYDQIKTVTEKTDDKLAHMSTIAAILYHKMDDFFWCGFYRLLPNGKLTVGPYQGPVACQELEKDKGVCWAGINSGESIIVDDVEKFPGHIACDSRSKSEIVIPIKDKNETTIAVLDVDSKDYNSFNDIDRKWLEQIVNLI